MNDFVRGLLYLPGASAKTGLDISCQESEHLSLFDKNRLFQGQVPMWSSTKVVGGAAFVPTFFEENKLRNVSALIGYLTIGIFLFEFSMQT